jgi:homoserine acetyltransferase
MGGQQAYTMAALFPEFVENIVCLAGSARTSSHNWCVLEGLKHTLMHSEDFKDGIYTEQASKGLKAFDRVYCPWALSEEFLRKTLQLLLSPNSITLSLLTPGHIFTISSPTDSKIALHCLSFRPPPP